MTWLGTIAHDKHQLCNLMSEMYKMKFQLEVQFQVRELHFNPINLNKSLNCDIPKSAYLKNPNKPKLPIMLIISNFFFLDLLSVDQIAFAI